jgi:uncharacterized protein
MLGKGFWFETKNGNRYYYDDLTGYVSPETKSCGKKRAGSAGMFAVTSCAVTDTWHKEQPSVEGSCVNLIEQYLKTEGYKQLVLIITEDCNLRCRYCVYSGNYAYERVHRQLSMTWDVAREAIEWYIRKCLEVKAANPRKIPAVSFYGGEPLMHSSMIRRIITHARKLYSGEIVFNLTTNGTMLTENIVDFLVNNGIALTVTLNGPQSEHDRLRVFPDGSGTFHVVLKNLLMVREKYPKYYMEKCNLIVDYDWGTDLGAVAGFFEEQTGILKVGRVGMISPSFTKWYEQYSSDKKRAFVVLLEDLKDAYIADILKGKNVSEFLAHLFAEDYENIIDRPYGNVVRSSLLPYTGACVPGEKIAVDPTGGLHCCEKMNYYFPIGNIALGLDLERIIGVVETYRRELYPACVDCSITRLCMICYAVVAGAGKFEKSPQDLCHVLRSGIEEKFAELWSLFEANAKESAFLRVASKRHSDFCVQ